MKRLFFIILFIFISFVFYITYVKANEYELPKKLEQIMESKTLVKGKVIVSSDYSFVMIPCELEENNFCVEYSKPDKWRFSQQAKKILIKKWLKDGSIKCIPKTGD
ncbi:MAG: hypothetical protein RBR32_03690 [Bacteroidales bacterium]|nr:hypothetical protein [Bacteroidales bacterium]